MCTRCPVRTRQGCRARAPRWYSSASPGASAWSASSAIARPIAARSGGDSRSVRTGVRREAARIMPNSPCTARNARSSGTTPASHARQHPRSTGLQRPTRRPSCLHSFRPQRSAGRFAGNITEDTRIRASVPAIRTALDAGAAVMVTSHLGRPTEGEFKPEDSLAPVAKRLGELLGRDGAADRELGRRRAGRSRARSCCSRTAASTRARRRTRTSWRRRWPGSPTCT